ncbi:hypothetical protein [Sphingorhabdus sp. EL138]|uniref:DUF6941 family protein n=1 Tax=Sphingorhabdus sp. EL138 TaxID=2073156 RepID=UPI0025F6888C|nr:hypothetical protein [Sphingorhabdus sp. EL138]
MILQPSVPGGYVIFCDDVRKEIGGKVTIVGVYGGELTAYGEAPLSLPQLYAVVSFRNKPNDDSYSLKVVVSMFGSDGEAKVLSSFDYDVPACQRDLLPAPIDEHSMVFIELSHIVRMSPLIITEPCMITVRAYLGDDEVRLGSLKVRITNMSEYTAHLPPESPNPPN